MITPTSSAQAQKAGGLTLIAEVDREGFVDILTKMDRPVVLSTRAGFPKAYKYLTRYDGYYILTKSKEPLDFSQKAHVIHTKKIHTSTDWLSL
ncbi:MAG: hypothetical protein ACE5G0_21390 [Rhodothermales bacterium]